MKTRGITMCAPAGRSCPLNMTGTPVGFYDSPDIAGVAGIFDSGLRTVRRGEAASPAKLRGNILPSIHLT